MFTATMVTMLQRDPRWPTPLEATKRLVGIVVLILNTTMVFAPIHLRNVVPALVIALIALAYLEEDGLLLSIALLAAVIVLTVAFGLGRWSAARNGSAASGNSSRWLVLWLRPTGAPVFRLRGG